MGRIYLLIFVFFLLLFSCASLPAPDDLDQLYETLGDFYFEESNWIMAADLYERSREIQQDDAELYIKLAMAYTQLGQYEKALTYLEQEDLNEAQLVKQRDARAYIYFLQQRFDEAITTYEQLLISGYYQDRFVYNLFQLYLHNEDTEAIILFADSNNYELEPDTRSIVAQAYFESDRWDEAVRNWELVKQAGSMSSQSLFNLSLAYENLGKKELALSVLSQFVEYQEPVPTPEDVYSIEQITAAMRLSRLNIEARADFSQADQWFRFAIEKGITETEEMEMIFELVAELPETAIYAYRSAYEEGGLSAVQDLVARK